jgi:hypothetical protein
MGAATVLPIATAAMHLLCYPNAMPRLTVTMLLLVLVYCCLIVYWWLLLSSVANSLTLVMPVMRSCDLYWIQLIHLDQYMLVARLQVQFLDNLDAYLSYCSGLSLL